MSELSYPYELSAREIAATALARSHSLAKLPRNILPLVQELMVDAAHDAIEFGEAIATLPTDQLTPLEHYHRGYLDAISDFEGETNGPNDNK